jgi:hypothetical protein
LKRFRAEDAIYGGVAPPPLRPQHVLILIDAVLTLFVAQHTGPYHGGSTELSLGGHMESGKTDRIEILVAQSLLDRRVS